MNDFPRNAAAGAASPQLKLRRAATPQSAAGAYGATQAQAAPAQPLPPNAGAAITLPSAPPRKGFLAANWPLMTAAAALLVGGVVMGMAVSSPAPPAPVTAVAPVAPLPQTPAPDIQEARANLLPESDRPALAPPPPPANPLPAEPASPATASPSAETAETPVEVQAVAKQPAPEPAAESAPKELAAAPVAPPSLPAASSPEAGVHAWRARAVAPPAAAKPPFVAIILDDAGLDRRNTARAMKLPGPITFSFMSYAADLAEQSAAARAAGHEVMLHLPMEPLDLQKNYPGPNALLLGLDDAELKRRLAWNLDRFDGYVGVNNHMGSRFTTDAARMSLVMEEIGRRQVFWLDSLSGPRSKGTEVARKAGIDTAERDLFLDDQRSPGIEHELAAMERIARARGDVIAIAHPHGSTLTALEKWTATAKERGFSLVPVSTVLLRRQQQAS